jgi:hypothetical protein
MDGFGFDARDYDGKTADEMAAMISGGSTLFDGMTNQVSATLGTLAAASKDGLTLTLTLRLLQRFAAHCRHSRLLLLPLLTSRRCSCSSQELRNYYHLRL